MFNIDGAVITANSTGIYAAGYAKWNIKDTTINGVDTAIEIRAGEMSIESGTFTASAVPTEVTPNGNGTTSSGSAMAVAQHTTKLPIAVSISGGTFEGYSAFYESNPQNNDEESIAKVNLEITGGVFNAVNGGSVAVFNQDCKGFISGGVFQCSTGCLLLCRRIFRTVGIPLTCYLSEPSVLAALFLSENLRCMEFTRPQASQPP